MALLLLCLVPRLCATLVCSQTGLCGLGKGVGGWGGGGGVGVPQILLGLCGLVARHSNFSPFAKNVSQLDNV